MSRLFMKSGAPAEGFSEGEQKCLREAIERFAIRELDYQFGQFLLSQGASKNQALFGILTSAELALGHVCVDLTCLDQTLTQNYRALVELWPLFDVRDLLNGETSSSIVGFIGSEPNHATRLKAAPLVIDNQRLYLQRYWQYEANIARSFLSLSQSNSSHGDTNSYPNLPQNTQAAESVIALMDQLFTPMSHGAEPEVDWQKVAACVALRQRLTLISGGPGTGKTTTVSKILALLVRQHQHQSQKPMRIKLAAPTGKAAARLSESINGAMAKLGEGVSDAASLLSQIPDHATTIHRLLGVIPNQPQFRHHAHNPLHLDLLVVDEASMIDLPMMAKLLAALPAHARVIFLGDHDQLASVEAGGVLADLCANMQLPYSAEQQAWLASLGCVYTGVSGVDEGASNTISPLVDCRVLLQKSYRFHDQSGIGFLAKAVNQGSGFKALAVFNKGFADISRQAVDEQNYSVLISQYCQALHDFLTLANDTSADASKVLAAFSQSQLLCALRRGPYGVEGLNLAIRRHLSRQQWFNMDSQWYVGRPVMVNQNDPSLKLYNGDIGVCLAEPDGQLKVWFAGGDDEAPRSFLPSRLPSVETVFAMTIHKSQGSEFDTVYLLLPKEDNAVVTRELVYTGITRAKKHCMVYAEEAAIKRACARKTLRTGGLAQRLGLAENAG